MKLHSLYLANGQGLAWSAEAKARLGEIVTAAFAGFTLSSADGYFQGRPTPTMIITIATDETGRVRAVAETLRCAFDQQAVGLALDGNYERITGAAT